MYAKLNKSQSAIIKYFKQYPTHHPSAEEVYMFVKEKHEKMGLATVYRNLHRLVDMGFIAELNIEKQGVRYDLLSHEHQHFVCDMCRGIENFTLPTLHTIHEDVEAQVSGTLTGAQLTFRGICKTCLEKESDKV